MDISNAFHIIVHNIREMVFEKLVSLIPILSRHQSVRLDHPQLHHWGLM